MEELVEATDVFVLFGHDINPYQVPGTLSIIRIRASCEIEDFVVTHLCKLCDIACITGCVFILVLVVVTRKLRNGQKPEYEHLFCILNVV